MRDSQNRLRESIKRLEPNLAPESVKAAFFADLDLEQPDARGETVALLLADCVRIYTNGVRTASLSLSEVREFTFRRGVGCVFCECEKQDGERVLLARGTATHQAAVSGFVRAANRLIKKQSEPTSGEREKKHRRKERAAKKPFCAS